MKLDNKIGILGGGQLGKMLCQAAMPLHLKLSALDKDENMPAAPFCVLRHGDFINYDDVIHFGKDMDIISIEIEKVNLEGLIQLENDGKTVIPSSHVVRTIRDKGLQKQFYVDHNLPTSNFTLYDDRHAIWTAILEGRLSYPFVQKARRGGYDGQGVAVIKSEQDLPKLMDTASLVEDLIDIKKEVSIIVARNPSGQLITFPAVEMVFDPEANLVDYLFSPTEISSRKIDEAIEICTVLANKIELTGLLAIEFFLTQDEEWLINEVAPRPHNSGHHTIEACNYSQYDIHLKCLLDFPLPPIKLLRPAAMINLLGAEGYHGKPIIANFDEILNLEDVFFHWYGKKETRPNRKMGHITILGESRSGIENKINFIKSKIKIIA